MRHVFRYSLACIIGGLYSQISCAALSTVSATGDVLAAKPYMTEKPSGSMTPQQKALMTSSVMFPVKSQLTEGKLDVMAVNIPALQHAIFVIGDDAASIQWAKQHAVQLKKLQAIGLLTNTDSQVRWQAIEQETELTLIPVSLEGLGTLVQVSHYPFLLSQHWLEQ